MNVDILPGQAVLTDSGRFVHIAKSETITVCGKVITRFYNVDARRADCHVCQRRPGRR